MQSLNFDDGNITLCINEDPDKKISFNPTDVGFVERFYELINDFGSKEHEFQKRAEELDRGEKDENGAPKNLKEIFDFTNEVDKYFKEKLDYVFGEGVSGIAFNGANVMSVSKGKPILQHFIEALMPYISNARQAEVSKRVSKYKRKSLS